MEQNIAQEPDTEVVADSVVADAQKPGGKPSQAVGAQGRYRFVWNLLANVANVVLNVVVGIWFAPYLIRNIGLSAYGLVPLTTQLISYFTLLTLGLNSSVGRYLTISLERNDNESANGFFNTSLFGSLLIALALVVPSIFIVTNARLLIDIPQGLEAPGKWLVASTIIAFLITTISSPFEVASYCRNRFDLRNAVLIASVVVRVGTAVVLFELVRPSLWWVGVGIVAAAVVGLVGSVAMWRRLLPMLTVSIRHFDWRRLRELTSTGGWIVINQIGTLLYLSIDLILVNRMFGAESGGRYAAVLQWSMLLRSMAGAVAGVFGPTMLYLYARSDSAGLVAYSTKALRFSGLLLALPIGLICGLSRPILHVWLGADFVPLAPLMLLMTIHLSINLGVLSLFQIQVVTNRVQWPGIITCVMGLANLGLAYVLAGPTGWGMYGIAAAGAITMTAKNAVFTPLYAAHIIGAPRWAFLKEAWSVAMMTLATTAACWMLSSRFDVGSWMRLSVVGALVTACYVTFVFRVLLTPEERGTAGSMLASVKSKFGSR